MSCFEGNRPIHWTTDPFERKRSRISISASAGLCPIHWTMHSVFHLLAEGKRQSYYLCKRGRKQKLVDR